MTVCCDVGGGTGRAIFEIDRCFPAIERLVLVEPSRRFCDWARLLLMSDDDLPEIPEVGAAGSTRLVLAARCPLALPSSSNACGL